jgi:hypothetical protein
MPHPESVTLNMTVEEASVLRTSLECYRLWLEAHPEQVDLRADLPAVEKLSKEVQQQVTAQSPQRGSGRPAWYGRTHG